MKISYRLGASLAVLALAVVYVSAMPSEQTQEVSLNENTNAASTRMGGLLDFANYKKLFKKSYSSLLEEAARFKYFTASALQTAAAAIKYRFRLISYYLSLNHMSDWSREEFEKLRNNAFAKWARSVRGARGRQQPAAPTESSVPELVPDNNENVAEEVRELVDEHKGEPVYEQLGELLGAKSDGQHDRRKRETNDDKPLPQRDLPIEKLVNTGDDQLARDIIAQETQRTNAPPVSDESSKQSFKDNLLPMTWHSYESHDKAIYDLQILMQSIDVKAVRRNLVHPTVKEHGEQQGDEVYADLRETGCIGPVRYQHGCGACYAFATIAIMEFLYCKNNEGKKVRFSEQYMVDCGRHVGLDGCDGGAPTLVPSFVRNFGLYLSELYPVRIGEGQCPYDGQSVELEQTGYMRTEHFEDSFMMSREHWGMTLKHGPMLVGADAHYHGDFHLYGGGVLTGRCDGDPAHAVVLIGHGRQDGHEYWLIRNSWGSQWGEGGYIKVDKESNCIGPNLGFAYGVHDPGHFGEIKFVVNEANAAEAVSRFIDNDGQSTGDADVASGQDSKKHL